MESLIFLEWVAVAFNLGFVLLIIKENKWGWPLGILGSLVSTIIFYQSQYYSEAVLYSFYIFVGFYGWKKWTNSANQVFKITEWPIRNHALAFILGIIGFLGLGYFFLSTTDADKPFADSFSTVFSFIATYLEAKKILSAWIYWIILNAYSIWLYAAKGLEIYAGLMVVYAVLSAVGFVQWRRSMVRQSLG